MSQLHVVSDPHGHLDELVAALASRGLVNDARRWSGGDGRLWFLGDLFDRGPDGVGIVDLVMGLQQQAASVGGHVGAVLGNHEVLALGMHQFGTTTVPSPRDSPRSFARSWFLNGGKPDDQLRLEPHHLEWLRALPALVLEDSWLLMHSDTDEYLHWGRSVDEVNTGLRAALADESIESVWEVWRRLTTRYAFIEEGGRGVAQRLLAALGAERLVHGHSIVATLVDGIASDTTEPLSYAGGLALAVDGGLYDDGPLLVVRLDDR